jgi:hypothetical protein
MALLEEAIYTRTISQCPSLNSRFYPVLVQQGASYPAARYIRIDDPEVATTHDGGPAGLSRPRFQIDIFALSFTEARDAAEEVRLCWEGYQGVEAGVTIGAVLKADRRDSYDSGTKLFSTSFDFFFWHNEPVNF